MDWQIAVLLLQDGLTNGAVYALLGIAIVLVFAVTRIIFVPQGEFVTYGALTLASLQAGVLPGSVWLLLVVALAVVAAAVVADRASRARRRPAADAAAHAGGCRCWSRAAAWWLAPMKLPLPAQVLLTLAIITPLGPLLYRAVFQPIADASVLVLLIASVALHFALTGLALVFFGAEGFRTPAFSDGGLSLGSLTVSGQSLWIYGVTGAADRRDGAVLRLHAARQGAARDRLQPDRRAADRLLADHAPG